jgi:hypothetical protein
VEAKGEETLAENGGSAANRAGQGIFISNTQWGRGRSWGQAAARSERNTYDKLGTNECVAVLVIGGARPVPGNETDLSIGRRLTVCPFVKRLSAWGSVGSSSGEGKALGAKHREFRYRRSARGWRAICLMVNENCHRSRSKPQKD